MQRSRSQINIFISELLQKMWQKNKITISEAKSAAEERNIMTNKQILALALIGALAITGYATYKSLQGLSQLDLSYSFEDDDEETD